MSDRHVPSPLEAVLAAGAPFGHPSGSLGRKGAPLLASVPLFSGLSPRQLRATAERSKVMRFGPGRTLIAEGTRGDSMYVLLEGSVRVVSSTVGRTIARLRPGDFFGELSMLDGEPRSASVVAVGPVVAVRLSRNAFLRLVRDEPDIGIRVMEVLSRRLRAAERPHRV